MSARGRIIGAAALYVAIVFLAGFGFGIVRTLLVAPHIGALAAVALELPLLLAVSYLVAGPTMRRFQIRLDGEALAMGALAFILLMATEFAFAALLAGIPPAAYLASFATAPGALGLAGQILFALVPLARRRWSPPQYPLPCSARNAVSSAVLARPSTAFRCGKRPKRAMRSRCLTAKSR